MYTRNVRIGNWQEDAVVNKLGTFDPKDRSTQILTGKRVIEHDDQIPSKEYASVLRDTYPDPKNFPDYSPVIMAGPRQKASEARMRSMIDAEFAHAHEVKEQEKQTRYFETSAKSANSGIGFVAADEKIRTSNFETKSADYATERAITYYTHTLENSKDGLNFPVTLVSDFKKPWSKVSQVSEDLGNGVRRIRENWEHPHPLPTLAESKILQTLRKNLLQVIPGNGLPGSKLRELFEFLLPLDHDGKGWIYVEEVASGLSERYGIEWTQEEKIALLRAFDHDRCHGIKPGRMRYREFMDLIRSPLSPRKQEIVDIVFNVIDSAKSGFITIEDIIGRWRGSEDVLDGLMHSLELYNGHAANLMQSIELRAESYNVRVFSIFYKDFVTENGEDTESFENFIESCWRFD